MGLLSKFKRGLEKSKNFFARGFDRIAARMGNFDEDMLDELEDLLLRSDMGINCVEELMGNVRAEMKAQGRRSREFVLSTLRAGMLNILGPRQDLELNTSGLTIILLVGVNGTGKTTAAGKLCYRYGKEGKKVLLAAADTFRAAAIDQLRHWAELSGTAVIAHQENSDPTAVVFDALQAAKARRTDILVIDTAGRLQTKQNLMDELNKMRRIIAREAGDAICHTLLVIDATTGQNAISQARLFTETAAVNGLILTKLDGNAKGGIALAVAWEKQCPIFFAGLGEGVEDLEVFDPESFVDSLIMTE
ncbi:MAG: signal recognition particle-docking protein FtsY [Clostridiaceae bacterium]|nr:signal recognition particle-docking protein FtsY [Clostridiaceae bacterium]